MSRERDVRLVLGAFSAALEGREYDFTSASKEGHAENIVRIASTMNILPALHAAMPATCRPDDDDLSAFLHSVADNNRRRNGEIFGIMRDAADALRAAGIDPVWLKGAAQLLDGGESVLASRFLNDVDLLVQPDDFENAITTLNMAGFAKLDEARTEPPGSFDISSHKHYPRLIRKEDCVGLEVHSRILDRSNDPFAREMDMAGDAVSVPSGNSEWRLPSLRDRLFHLVHHSMVGDGHYEQLRISLKDQLDLHALSASGLGEDGVRSVANVFARQGCEAHFSAFAQLAARVQPSEVLASTGIEGFAGDGGWAEEAFSALAHPWQLRLREARDTAHYYLRRWRDGTPLLSANTLTHAQRAVDRVRINFGKIR